MFGITVHNPYFEMVMAYHSTYLLLPSFCAEEGSGFFCFVLVINDLVDFYRDTSPDEIVPSYFILIFDEC